MARTPTSRFPVKTRIRDTLAGFGCLLSGFGVRQELRAVHERSPFPGQTDSMLHPLTRIWILVALLVAGVCAPRAQAEETAVSAAVKEALSEGFEVGRKHAEAAQVPLAKARSAAPQDPRVPYAAGLVLYKQMQRKEAAAEFERAARLGTLPYWPAWRAWVWCGFRERDLSAGTKRLEMLVKAVSESHAEPAEVEVLVAWCGQVLGAAQRTETEAESQALLIESEARLRERLDSVLEDALDEGLFSLNAVEEELDRSASDANLQFQVQQEKRLATEKKRSTEALQRITGRQEAARRTAEDWKVWMDEEVKRRDRELSTLSKGQAHLQKRAASLQLSIFSKISELSTLEVSRTQAFGDDARRAIDLQIQRCRGELSMLEMEHAQSLGTANIAARQQAQTAASKQGLIQQYEQSTKSLASRQSAMAKLSERVKSRLNARPKTAVRKPERPTFVQLVPFDLDTLRQELLEDLETTDANVDP